MKLIASILLFSVWTASAHAQNQCTSTIEPLIKDLWRVKPQFIDEKKTMYGFPVKKEFYGVTYKGQKDPAKISSVTYKKYQAEGWVPSEASYKTDALHGQRIEVKATGSGYEILRTGYVNKDSYADYSNHYFTRADDVRIVLNSSCKLVRVDFLRPKPISVSAQACAWIRDYKIKDLAKNMNEIREIVQAKLKSDPATTDRIVMSCRNKVGTNTPPLVKLLPSGPVRSIAESIRDGGKAAQKAQ